MYSPVGSEPLAPPTPPPPEKERRGSIVTERAATVPENIHGPEAPFVEDMVHLGSEPQNVVCPACHFGVRTYTKTRVGSHAGYPHRPHVPLDLVLLELRLIRVECGRRFVALRVVSLRRFCPLFYHLVRTSNTSVPIVCLPSENVLFYAGSDLKAALGWQSIVVDMGLVKSIPWETPLSQHPTNDHKTPHLPFPPPHPNNLLNNLLFVCDSPHIPRFHIFCSQYLVIRLFRGFIRSLGSLSSSGGALIYFCCNKKSTCSSPSIERVTPSSLPGLLIILFPRKSRASPLVHHITHDIDAQFIVYLARLLLIRSRLGNIILTSTPKNQNWESRALGRGYFVEG